MNAKLQQESLSAIAQHFAIPGACISVVPYGSGHINDTYRVVFHPRNGAEEHYILQRINTRIFKDPLALMQNIQRVTSHLASRVTGSPDSHRHVLTLIPSGDGWPIHADPGGGIWRCYRFIENARTFDIAESPAQAYEAAFAFGRFQGLLADLPAPRLHDTIPGFHNTPSRLEAFERVIAADSAQRVQLAQPEIDFLLARRSLARQLLDANLPERVTHNDTKINNVMFDERSGKGICVIDLDTVMPGLALYDFGDMVRTMTSSAAEDETDLAKVEMRFSMFEAITRGYLAAIGNTLTLQEKQHLIVAGKVITYEQALRFLADYLAGDPYYKTHRPNHNLDRCRTQVRLLASIEEQEKSMQALLASLIHAPHS
jgi:hypothetical protein